VADRVLVPLPGVGTLALTDDAYRAALAEGAKLNHAPALSGAATDEPLMEAEQLAGLLNVPVTWLEQKAREGVIPSLEFGRWRRFRRSEVEAAVRASRGNGA
jgi:excisionase family DNA binding protein